MVKIRFWSGVRLYVGLNDTECLRWLRSKFLLNEFHDVKVGQECNSDY